MTRKYKHGECKAKVHALLLKGWTNAEIAERLGVCTAYIRSTITRNGWKAISQMKTIRRSGR